MMCVASCSYACECVCVQVRVCVCICRYLHDVRGQLQLRSLSTGELKQNFDLPGVGSVTGFSGE